MFSSCTQDVAQVESARGANDSGKPKKKGKSPSTLRHAVKKAEEAMSAVSDHITKIDEEMAVAAAKDPKKFESLSRKRAQLQTDLENAEAAWVAAEEELAEVS